MAKKLRQKKAKANLEVKVWKLVRELKKEKEDHARTEFSRLMLMQAGEQNEGEINKLGDANVNLKDCLAKVQEDLVAKTSAHETLYKEFVSLKEKDLRFGFELKDVRKSRQLLEDENVGWKNSIKQHSEMHAADALEKGRLHDVVTTLVFLLPDSGVESLMHAFVHATDVVGAQSPILDMINELDETMTEVWPLRISHAAQGFKDAEKSLKLMERLKAVGISLKQVVDLVDRAK